VSVTLIRKGDHQCDLPTERLHDSGDMVRCDHCGKAWQLYKPRGWAGRWERVSRFAAWRSERKHRGVPPVDTRSVCGNCHLPVDDGLEWCPRCTKCPEHGNLCFPGASYGDCPNAAKTPPGRAS
jgi:hypothetical protein